MNKQRFYKVFVWNFISQRNQMMREFLFVALVFLAFMLLPQIGNLFSATVSQETLENMMPIIALTSGLFLLRKASDICYNMNTKSSFVTYSMLPATKAEKYFVNVLFQTVFRIVIILLGIVAADIVQYAVCYVITNEAFCGTKMLFHLLTSFPDLFSFLYVLTLLIFIQSTFVLGGCFFRRHAMLLTVLSWFIIPMLLSLLAGGVMYSIITLAEGNGYVVYIEPLVEAESLDMLMSSICILLTIISYWLSYVFFCRMQIINNRWIN